MPQKKFDHQPPTYTYFLNISKKEEKKHRMSSAGKKIDSLTFLLFKEKKMFSSTHHHPNNSSTNFSLFLKMEKTQKNIFKKMHVLSKNKNKN